MVVLFDDIQGVAGRRRRKDVPLGALRGRGLEGTSRVGGLNPRLRAHLKHGHHVAATVVVGLGDDTFHAEPALNALVCAAKIS